MVNAALIKLNIKKESYLLAEQQDIYLRLGEEVGELAREINHRFGPKPKKPAEQTIELGDEIADIFFTLICLANSQRIDLDEAWERMMEKYSNRDKDRFAKA